MKELIKPLVPSFLLEKYRQVHREQIQGANARKTAAEVFSEVYRRKLWGTGEGAFYSGPGSDPENASLYCDLVRDVVLSLRRPEVTIVDLGCGDFRVGSQFLAPGVRYIGIDVVSELIAHNTRAFGGGPVSFLCRDIVQDELPTGDICLVRQVLQHLSNAEIAMILYKLRSYQVSLITEHYPKDLAGCTANVDKPHGGDVRFSDNSAVFLDQPPFSVANAQLVLTVPHSGDWGFLKTFMLQQESQRL